MNSHTTEELYDRFVLGNYPKAPLTLVRGLGTRVWDDQGNEYLDLTGGIGVNALGHCHPAWVQQVSQQATTLVHTSNLFRNELQGRLAAALVEKTGPGKVFFCNSGMEANEALLKLSRRHGIRKAGVEGKCHKVITAKQAFHGRSFGTMTATPQEKIQKGFAPLLPGFSYAELNNLASFEALIDEETAAILIEPVQGEGGVHACTPEFLRGLRELCDRHELLLLLDEVQSGLGRTGQFFAFQESGIVPDAVAIAKGLGGGFPIGAMWVRDKNADLLPPGSHGTTFGGSPLGSAAALATISVIESENLLAHVRKTSEPWMKELAKLRDEFPELVLAVRGRGFMVGVQLAIDPAPVLAEMRARGVLAVSAGGNVVRFLPPLNTSAADLDRATETLRDALASVAETSRPAEKSS